MKTSGVDTVARLEMRDGALEVGTSLERLRPTSCLTGNALKQKSVCGKACQGGASTRECISLKYPAFCAHPPTKGEPYGPEVSGGRH
jgi:hypothetical protein